MNEATTQALSPAPGGRLTVSSPLTFAEWALMALALLAVHILLQDNGTFMAAQAAEYLHEITHDARHALGVPCH